VHSPLDESGREAAGDENDDLGAQASPRPLKSSLGSGFCTLDEIGASRLRFSPVDGAAGAPPGQTRHNRHRP
jgi:hypothetical protein